MTTPTQVWSYRELIGNLARREVLSQYKSSSLGRFWSLINPAATLLTYSIVFGLFLKVVPPVAGDGETRSFALYLFAGLVAWNFFAGTVTGSMGALIAAGPLLRRVYFPPEAPVLASMLARLNQTVLEAAVLLVACAAFGVIGPTYLLYPVVLALLAMFATGIGFVVALLNVYFRDVGHLVAILLNLLFYATAIVYPLDLVPEHLGPLPARRLIALNPLTQFVEASRDAVYLLQVPSLVRVAGLVAVSGSSLAFGWWLFHRYGADVSEEL